MTKTLLRAGALSCALLATTCLTAPAAAQSTSTPAYRHLDANGVDLARGDYILSFTEGSIGAGPARLALERRIGAGGGPSQWDQISYERTISGTVVTVTIGIGNLFERFTGSTLGGGWTSNLQHGSSFDGFTYTRRDGTRITFEDPTGNPQGGATNFCKGWSPAQCRLLPVEIAAPDGGAVDLQWTTHELCSTIFNPDGSLDCEYFWRLGTVSNSYGYSIGFTYATNSAPSGGQPSASWYRRSRADFYNSAAGSSSQAGVSYAYPVSGEVEVTDTGGRVWGVAPGAIRRPGASGYTTQVTTGAGGIVTQVVRDGVTTGYARSVSGNTGTMTVTNALSQQTVIVSDLALNRPTSITDALGRTTSFQYDTAGRLTRVTQPEGNYVQYTLDGRGNITETRAVAKSGSGLADIVTTATFAASCTDPSCNSPLTTTDARGNTTDYTYDATHGGVLTVTAPAVGGVRPQTRYSYTLTNGEYRLTEVSACASGTAPSCVGTAAESRTIIGHDAAGNVTSLQQRDGTGALSATSTMTWDALGNLLTIDGPLTGTADTTRFRYNAARQLVGTVGPDPDGGDSRKHRAQRTTYSSTTGLPTKTEIGTVNSQSDGDWAAFASLEEVQQDYDANARPTVQRLVSGGTTYALTQTSYDGLGRVQCAAQRMNPSEFASLPASACTLDTEGSFGPDRIVRTSYDAAGQVTKVETALGVTGVAADEVTATYRNNGQVETVTDAEGNRTTYVYDGHDRLSRTRMPSPATDNVSSTTDYEELSYDAGSNVTNRRLRDNTNIAYGYDALNRLTSKDLPGSEPTVSYSYDLLGRQTGASVSGHSLTFSHDALGRNLTQVGPQGTVSYGYDAAGRRTSMTYPGSGLVVGYSYDTTGNVTEIRENPSGGNVLLASYEYDNSGRRTLLTRGNGTVTDYDYDPVSRLDELVQNLDGTANDLTLGLRCQFTECIKLARVAAWPASLASSFPVSSTTSHSVAIDARRPSSRRYYVDGVDGALREV